MSREVQHAAAQRTREAVVEALQELTFELGFPPTREEIAERTGLSKTHVVRVVKDLKAEGVLEERQGPRTLRFVF